MKDHSLQKALIRSVLLVAIFLSTVGAVIAAVIAFNSAKDLQDDVLHSIAILVQRNTLDAPLDRRGQRKNDEPEDEAIVIRRLSKENLGQPPYFAINLTNGLHTLSAMGEQWRVEVISSHDSTERYAIAQQTSLRNDVALGSSLYVLLPLIFMTLILLLLVPYIVHRIFKPLGKLSNELDSLAAEAVPAIDERDMPNELRPFVNAISRLLDRNREVLSQQRRFIADAAHELRTPVAVLKISSENLANAASENDRILRQSIVHTGIERLQSLVVNLLDLTRARDGVQSMLQPVLLPGVIREVVEDLQPMIIETGVDVGLKTTQQIWVMDANQVLSQLCRNALENAINHSKPGDKVDISISQENTTAVLYIEDNGPGISEEDMSRVREPFYRSSFSTYQGSGLGLAICDEIAKQLGGSITLENRESNGLRFCYRQAIAASPPYAHEDVKL